MSKGGQSGGNCLIEGLMKHRTGLGLALLLVLVPVVRAIGSEFSTLEYRTQDQQLQVRVWTAPHDPTTSHYAFRTDGGDWTRARTTRNQLALRLGRVDPMDGLPAFNELPESQSNGRLWIVQFHTQSLESYRSAMTDAGVIIRSFLPENAHVVEASPEQAVALTDQPFVRWVGPYRPILRLDPALMDDGPALALESRTERFNIMVFEGGPVQKTAVAVRIANIGGVVHRANAGKQLVDATLTPDQLLQVVTWDEVQFVDLWSPMQADMDIAREITGANMIESVAGYAGQGVRGEVIDLGFNPSHLDFQSRPLIHHTPIEPHSHGAATSGILFGDGTANPLARGMLPLGQGIIADGNLTFTGVPRYDHTAELLLPPYEAVFQSSSVGNDRTTEYTTLSADLDAALFDFDILHCQSQSNAGSQLSRPQAWAKNIVSVGGIRHHNTLTRDDDCWDCVGTSASIGPAADGRIKPDLSHFYDLTLTTSIGSDHAYTPTFGGTSGATPIVAGHFGIFFQMWADGVFGNLVPSAGSVFDKRPHMTTAKAMLINTAQAYPFQGEEHDLTRVHQGWGLPSLQNLHEARQSMFVIDESVLLENLASAAFSLEVVDDSNPLRCTLVYADPPGNPAATVHRVNDLSLRVTSPDGTEYWGNNGLLAGLWSIPDGQPNSIDTVENVFIEHPSPGLWLIEVFADEIVQDGHVETAALDADFALVVSGVAQQAPALAITGVALPALVPPDEPVELEFQVISGSQQVQPDGVEVHYRFGASAAFNSITAQPSTEKGYLATLPPPSCGDVVEYFITATGDGGSTVSVPPTAPDSFYSSEVGVYEVAFADTFETESGWIVFDQPGLTDGSWQRAIPVAECDRGNPTSDADGSGSCFVTDNDATNDCNSDVDGGATSLISPAIAMSGVPLEVQFQLWHTNNAGVNPDEDVLTVLLSDDDGQSWSPALLDGPMSHTGWSQRSIQVGDFITLDGTLRVRFDASDLAGGSIVEAGVDAFEVRRLTCRPACFADGSGDGIVDTNDLLGLLGDWGSPSDDWDIAPTGGDGAVDALDLLALLGAWGPCP